MRSPRVTLGKIALAWAALLFAAALILPNLTLHTRSRPAVMVVIAAYWVMLLIGTPIALIDYFNRAWRKLDATPNRATYILWLSLESVAGAGFLAMLLYATIMAVGALR